MEASRDDCIALVKHLLAQPAAPRVEIAAALGLGPEKLRAALRSVDVLISRPEGGLAGKPYGLKAMTRDCSEQVLEILRSLPSEPGVDDQRQTNAELVEVLVAHLRSEFGDLNVAVQFTDLYFVWLVRNDLECAKHLERIRLALEALRSQLGDGRITLIGAGGIGHVFEHEASPGWVFKVKEPDRNEHFLTCEREMIRTEELSDLVNRDKLLVSPTRGGLVSSGGAERVVLRQPKGTPLEHLLRFIAAKGPANYRAELEVLAESYVRLQALLLGVGRVNTDANVTNHLVDSEGHFLLHDLDIIIPSDGLDYHATPENTRYSELNLVEFLFWFLANNLRDGDVFAEPFKEALTKDAYLVEYRGLVESQGWPALANALQAFANARFLGPELFHQKAAAAVDVLRSDLPGAIERIRGSVRELRESKSLSKEPGVQLGVEDLRRIEAMTSADDFIDIVVFDKPAASSAS